MVVLEVLNNFSVWRGTHTWVVEVTGLVGICNHSEVIDKDLGEICSHLQVCCGIQHGEARDEVIAEGLEVSRVR